MTEPVPQPQILSLSAILKIGTQVVRENFQAFLFIALSMLVVPQLIVTATVDAISVGSVESIRSWHAQFDGKGGLMPLVQILIDFAVVGGLLYAPAMFLFLVGLFALYQLSICHYRRQETDLWQVVKQSLKGLLPKGVIAIFLVMLLAFVTQMLVFPFIIIIVLSSMIPVMILAERKSGIGAFGSAMTLSYARQRAMPVWGTFFALVALNALFYCFLVAVQFLSEAINSLHFLASLGNEHFLLGAQGPSMIYQFSEGLHVLLFSLGVAFLPPCLVGFYFESQKRTVLAEV